MYQMKLSHEFGGISLEEAQTRMHHTKSTQNQKIEALWLQMMKQHNWSIIDNSVTHQENGILSILVAKYRITLNRLVNLCQCSLLQQIEAFCSCLPPILLDF